VRWERIGLITLAFLILLATSVAGFLFWKYSRPLPPVERVEESLAEEIALLEGLARELDADRISLDGPKLPDLGQITGISPIIPSLGSLQTLAARMRDAEDEMSESGVLSAGIVLYRGDDEVTFEVKQEDSLHLWSIKSPVRESGSQLGFCFSDLRQLIRYDKVVAENPNETIAIRLIFPPELVETE